MRRLSTKSGGIVAFLWLLAGAGFVCAQTDEAAERLAKVESAFLLNFARYAEWPEEAFEDEESPLVITVLGRARLLPYLLAIVQDERVKGRPIQVRLAWYPHEDPDEDESEARRRREAFFESLRQSHMVFIPHTEAEHAVEVLRGLWGSDVLTVSDALGFREVGGMLELKVRRGRVVFDANVEAIEASDVKLSSKVLRLAQNVREGGGG